MDRGSLAILPGTAFNTPPLNINDADITPSTSKLITEASGLTEMSFFGMMLEVMVCHKRMSDVDDDSDSVKAWELKSGLVDALQESFKIKYFTISNEAGLFQRFIKAASLEIATSIPLVLRRPPCPQQSTTVPPWDDYDIMQEATEILQRSFVVKRDEFLPWGWKSWVQWHALAVALAELCSCPAHPIADAAWPVVSESFQRYASLIADAQHGMLWKPTARLMRRAQRLRRGRDTSTTRDPVRSVSNNESLTPTSGSSSCDKNVLEVPLTNSLYTLGWNAGDVGYMTPTAGFDIGEMMGELDTEDGLATFDWNMFLNDVNSFDDPTSTILF